MIKKIIKRIPFAKKIKEVICFRKEYNADRIFFKHNYSHSAETKAKIGYNILLIVHSLEKAMTNKHPRRFGVAKIEELAKLIDRYAGYGDYELDFPFICAVNILREYANFYEMNDWGGADECLMAKKVISKYKSVEIIIIGSFKLRKKEFEKDARIDYKKFLSSRHSIREFARRKIGAKDLKTAIEAAILSPSACNRQMCKVYNVSNESKRKKLIEMAQGFGGFEKETINTLVITFDVNSNYFIGERNQGWLNAGLFSMNLVNALHSIGIGSCFCQFGNSTRQEKTIKRILGIPDNERIAVILACGYYPEECNVTHSPRKKPEDVLKNVI